MKGNCAIGEVRQFTIKSWSLVVGSNDDSSIKQDVIGWQNNGLMQPNET